MSKHIHMMCNPFAPQHYACLQIMASLSEVLCRSSALGPVVAPIAAAWQGSDIIDQYQCAAAVGMPLQPANRNIAGQCSHVTMGISMSAHIWV